MHANELEVLKPGPGLVLVEITETVEAVKAIEAAHADLVTSLNEVSRNNLARRGSREVGVNCAILERDDQREWQATCLRQFIEIRGELAGKCLLLCDAQLAAEAAAIRQREDGLARGLGKLLHDEAAGADLALLLLRLSGGLPVDGRIRDVRNRWHNMCRESARALIELPQPAEPKPTASEHAAELRKLIEIGKEG